MGTEGISYTVPLHIHLTPSMAFRLGMMNRQYTGHTIDVEDSLLHDETYAGYAL